ncbi:serine/threonine-protein kinase pim-1-like [Puntigrus tetrazona]|uniref:serine/threonine-protein kinase pim-1-like n=1 Tax=Puntigrus tetrazona TaxID=1606681 RepID=UPI001C8AD6F1|nr:serine/threonine-protein kinase pim-1-like [Puntigrus tetrazona]
MDKEKADGGRERTPTDRSVELHPRPDGEGGGKERKGEKSKKKRQKQKWFRNAQDEQVEQGEVEQDTVPSRRCTDDQTSLQDVVTTVEDGDHQELPSSAAVVPAVTAEDQQVEDVQLQDQDSPDRICWKYCIGKKLGEGGCGSVFEGTRREDGLPVAVKFTVKTENEPYLSLPEHPRPVPLEVALTLMANQGPSCPHIIKLLDWEDQPDQYIMVLERPSHCMDMLSFWAHYDGHFSEEMARHFMRQVTDAAAACCSKSVFHRDIKMPNILVNVETLEVKLIDFGCGDLLKKTSYTTYSGTARYCPPEYIEKGEYDGKQATVWSLGVLLFRMMTRLFPDSSDIGLMDADAWEEPGISDECCRFIRGCLKSDPEQRLHLDEMHLHEWFKLAPSSLQS